MNSILRAQRLGQSIWIDDIHRDLFQSGELERLIGFGLRGMTSNPTIFERAIGESRVYDDAIRAHARSGRSAEQIYESLAIEDILSASDLLRPIHERSGGAHGFVSLEVSPRLAHDTESTIREARRLFGALDRPNVMIKVPGTVEGIPAIRRLIADGINVNVTLIFALDQYDRVKDAYVSGMEQRLRNGGALETVSSVASFFLSRIDTSVDRLLEERIRAGKKELTPLRGTAAISSAKLAYREFGRTFGDPRFLALKEKGARVQRPLWASTSTKNPAYSDVKYVEPLIGPETVNTMPQKTLSAFLDHGRTDSTLEQEVSQAEEALAALEGAGIRMKSVTDALLDDGIEAFASSFETLLDRIETKKGHLAGTNHRDE